MGLNGADTIEILLHLFRQIRKSFLHAHRLIEDPVGSQPANKSDERHQRQQGEGQRHRLGQHEDESDDPGKSEDEQQSRPQADHLADQLNVVDRARHQIAGRIPRKKSRPLLLQMPVELLTQGKSDFDTGLAHIAPAIGKGEIAQDHEAENAECRAGEPGVARRHPVDPDLQQKRHEGFEQTPAIDQAHAAPEQERMLMHQGHEPPKGTISLAHRTAALSLMSNTGANRACGMGPIFWQMSRT